MSETQSVRGQMEEGGGGLQGRLSEMDIQMRRLDVRDYKRSATAVFAVIAGRASEGQMADVSPEHTV